MGSLGNILRREREAQGLSLEEIAEKTKIGIRLLRAIESEQFERLPGGLFNKSFVRQYARLLGVDEEIAVREYLQAFGARKEASSAAARSRPPDPRIFPTESDSSRVILALLGVGILIAGIVYGGYLLYGYLTAAPASAEDRPGASRAVPAAIPPASAEPLAASLEEYETSTASDEDTEGGDQYGSIAGAGGDPGADAGSVTNPGSEPLTARARLSPAEGVAERAAAPVSVAGGDLKVRIETRGPVWLSITADGVRQWQGSMRANETREVQAAESVGLTVGDAGAVSLTLNGKPLPELGRSGEVRNLTITAKDAAGTSP